MATAQASPTVHAPTVAEVERIAACPQPVLRNLLITQCYCEQSAAFAGRTGPVANWCTFATWASRQAGQTIRQEDLQRTLAAAVAKDPELEESIGLLHLFAGRLGFKEALEPIRRSALGTLFANVSARTAEAVARGNKKVFEEIAYQFARFHEHCFSDLLYSEEHLQAFCNGLKDGLPPDGQDYLKKAFTHYYQSFFEENPRKKTELCFLANLEIGFHEQTRLQPEIAEALNAGSFSPEAVKKMIIGELLSKAGLWMKLRFFFQRLFGKAGLLEETIQTLAEQVQLLVRRTLTDVLMTLTLPPDNRLRLGKDLTVGYPAALKTLEHEALIALIKEIDPMPDSLLHSGATDWANFQERMHFISELFRCYHEDLLLFNKVFSEWQVGQLKEGKVPDGDL